MRLLKSKIRVNLPKEIWEMVKGVGKRTIMSCLDHGDVEGVIWARNKYNLPKRNGLSNCQAKIDSLLVLWVS